MSRISRGTPEGDAYLDLQQQARKSGRPTDELIVLYVLEGFLARLAASAHREKFVLKGGVLLAAFGNRRPTRDVDLAGLDLNNDAEIIREDDEYAGVRVSADARLASARPRFHVDINVGDPIWPEPMMVSVPRLMGGEPIELAGYPLHMVHAEKIVTAVQRGTANTRWRDFADVWTLSNQHAIDGSNLRHAIDEVASHRRAQLSLLRIVLDGYAEIAQDKWAGWRRRNGFDHLPEPFELLLDAVIAFADPVLAHEVDERSWNPSNREWQ